jgi:AmpD protein
MIPSKLSGSANSANSANSDWTIAEDGWCQQALRQESPHFNVRPDPADISLLVIHNISLPAGQFGGPAITELFQNCLDCNAHESFDSLRNVQVSSHFLIRRDGRVLQFVSTLDRAWHAGVSSFDGRVACNDFSIGIELEGTDNLPFEPAQYASLTLLTQALLARFAISHIVGHDEIAPGRKTDPGPCFDWDWYERSITDL